MGEKFGLGRHKHNLDGHDGGRDGRTEGGKEGFCIQLNCAGEGECQNRERDRGENRSGKGGREGDKGSKEGRSIIDGFVGREQNKNAPHVC